MTVKCGLAFWYLDSSGRKHLYVVISKPDPSGGVLVVNVTSRQRFSDPACHLVNGDHKCITHDSCIAFDRADIWRVAELEAALKSGAAEVEPDVCLATLTKIWDGAARSAYLKRDYKSLLKAQGVI